MIAPRLVIVDRPDINLSLSSATSAVKSSSVDVCELTWPTLLASSTLKLLTAVSVELEEYVPEPLSEIASLVVNVPTTSCIMTWLFDASSYATIPVAPEIEPVTLSPALKLLDETEQLNIVNILISNRYRFRCVPLYSSIFLTLANPIWPT